MGKSVRKRWFVGMLGLVLAGAWLIWRAPPTPQRGLREGRLAACPDSPNCVCSQAEDPRHAIEPLALAGDPRAALEQLREVLADMPGAKVVNSGDDYLHAEFTSRWLRFVDDLELYADATGGVIHVRSASRVGHADFGVNRRRVEELRRRYQARIKNPS